MTRALGLAALLVVGCKDEPKPVTVAGYTFTVAGWEPQVDEKKGFTTVTFHAFSEDAACLFQAVDAKDVTGEGIEKVIVEQFKGTHLTPASLDTALGKFTGHRFDGVVPAEGVTGKVAQLAGAPHVETLSLRDGDRLLAFTITHFGDDADGKASAQKCLKMLSTVARAK